MYKNIYQSDNFTECSSTSKQIVLINPEELPEKIKKIAILKYFTCILLLLHCCFNMAKPATFFANFPVNKQPSTFEVIRRYRSTYEGCDLVPLVTSSIGDSELIIHFQEA